MVDPYDTQAIAEAISMVLLNDGLRQALRTRGLEQARRFSWTETARRTLVVYEQIVLARGVKSL
jgi:glycosyltransferase involved in cell wall biosynthesis